MSNRKFTFRDDTVTGGIEETSRTNSNETLLADTYDSLNSFVAALRVMLDKKNDSSTDFNDSTTDILNKISELLKIIKDGFIGSYAAFLENSDSFISLYHYKTAEIQSKIIVKYLTPELMLQIETMLDMLGNSKKEKTFIYNYDNNKIPLEDVKNLLIKIVLEFYNSIRKAGPQFICRYLIDIIENELKFMKKTDYTGCVTNNLDQSNSNDDVWLYKNEHFGDDIIKQYLEDYEAILTNIMISLRNVLSNSIDSDISSQELEQMNKTSIKTSIAYSIIQDILSKPKTDCCCTVDENTSKDYEKFITFKVILSSKPEFLSLLSQLSKHEVTFMDIMGKTYEILKVAPSIPKILNVVGKMVSNSSSMFATTIPNKFRENKYEISDNSSDNNKKTLDEMFKHIYKICILNSFSTTADNTTQATIKTGFENFSYLLKTIIGSSEIFNSHDNPIILSFQILRLAVLISRIYINEALFFNGEDKSDSIKSLFKLNMSPEEIIKYFAEFGIQIEKYMVEQYQKWLDALYNKLVDFTDGNTSLSDRTVAEMVLKLYVLLLGRVATYLNTENDKILQIKLRTGLATAQKKFLKAAIQIKDESRSYEMRLKNLTRNRDSIDVNFDEIPLGDALKEIIKDPRITNLKIKYCCIFVLSTYQRFIPGNEDTIYDILGFDFNDINNIIFDNI